jgi:5-methylcytosine-specific restriction endonuclease McrA
MQRTAVEKLVDLSRGVVNASQATDDQSGGLPDWNRATDDPDAARWLATEVLTLAAYAPTWKGFEARALLGLPLLAHQIDVLATKVEAMERRASADVLPVRAQSAPAARRPSRQPSGPDRVSNPRAIGPKLRALVMERDGFRCRRCGSGPKEARLVVDHIVPVIRGGSGDEANLQVLCEDCNIGKKDRHPHPHDLNTAEVATC